MRAIVTIDLGGALELNAFWSWEAAAARWGVPWLIVRQGLAGRYLALLWRAADGLASGAASAMAALPATILGPASQKTEAFGFADAARAVLARTPGVAAACPMAELGEERHHELFVVDADTVVSARCPSPFVGTSWGPLDRTHHPRHARLVAVGNGNPQRCGDYQGIRGAELAEWGKLPAVQAGAVHTEPPAAGEYFNSGVMLARAGARDVFEAARGVCLLDLGLGWHDQTPLNFFALVEARKHAARRAFQLALVDETWNFIHPRTLGAGWEDMGRTGKYIYHFAGEPERAGVIERVRWE